MAMTLTRFIRLVAVITICALAYTALPTAGAQDAPPIDHTPPANVARAPAVDRAVDAVAQLHDLFDRYEAWLDRVYPERAMSRGNYTYADRITDMSLDAIESRHEQQKDFLDELLDINTGALPEDELVNYELFELQLRQEIDGFQYRTYLAPIGGRFGPQQRVPQMGERVRFQSLEDYEHYLARLEQVPTLIDQNIDLMRRGLREGRTPPRVTLAGLPGQFASLESGGLDMLRNPMQRMPDTISENDRRRLLDRFDNEIMPAVRTAMQHLRRFVVDEYIPNCRESTAATDWPNGEAYYNHELRSFTTTDMTAREIHELGLREVERIRGEMLEVIRRSDFIERFPVAGELDDDRLFNAFVHYLRTDARFYHDTEDALLNGYRVICKRIDAHLPRYFTRLPRLPYGVLPIPRFMAPSQTTAYYQPGDIRNAEPGVFYANTYGLDQRPKYEMIPLALHEAVPGHHLQIALAKELDGLPEFRKSARFTVFVEGWALYAERLGIEMGLYTDPYDDFGRLLYEMWRACRLVVDPGMHALGWSRDEAIAFMQRNTALSELNIETEVDRYIAWPGQATAYKIGELKIRELREWAERDLGERFDIRAFHDMILEAGAIPLYILERRANDWIRHASGD